MDAAQVIARLKAMEPDLRSAGIEALYLFGSRARGDFRADSDIDLMFDAGEKGLDLWARAEVMAAMVDRLGEDIDIDLVDRFALLPTVKGSSELAVRQVF